MVILIIHLITGRQGSGKTIYLVKKAYEGYKKGKIIYSNVHLKKIPYKQLDYQDIIDCKLENGIVILDEIHLLLSARNSMSKVNKSICDGFLSMVRKKGLIIYGTTQTMRKVDIRFREEADFIAEAKKFVFIDNHWKECPAFQEFPKSVPIMINIDILEEYSGNSIGIFFLGNEWFNKFDSRQIIHVRGLKV